MKFESEQVVLKVPSGKEAGSHTSYPFGPIVAGKAGETLKLELGTKKGYEGTTDKPTQGIQSWITGYTSSSESRVGEVFGVGIDHTVIACTAPSGVVLGSWKIQPLPPVVTGIRPSGGPEAGNTQVAITGEHLEAASKVDFGEAEANHMQLRSATELIATSPPHPEGAVDVSVTTPGGQSATSAADRFTYVPRPTVTRIEPASGPEEGDSTVMLTGEHLENAEAVKFGSANATSFKPLPDGEISAVSPPGMGTVDVTVETVGGQSANGAADHFTYVPPPSVTSVSPNAGPEAGGTQVTITGEDLEGSSEVDFGGTEATDVEVRSATEIVARSPAHPAGTVEVTVTTSGGQSASTASDRFDYVPSPSVIAIEPASGPEAGGTTVTVTGTNLSDATAVRFGAASAQTFEVLSEDEVKAVAPPGTGTVGVTVSTAGGTSATSAGAEFTYIERLTFKNWTLAGSLTARPIGQAITLPRGSTFNGAGEVNPTTGAGSLSGEVRVPAFSAAVRLLGVIPVNLGITLTQVGPAEGTLSASPSVAGQETVTLPLKLNLGVTSVGLLGLTIGTSCTTTGPMSLNLADTETLETLRSEGLQFAGTTSVSSLRCQGGLLGAAFGPVLTALLSGAGSSYSVGIGAPSVSPGG
jgi:hypothetical protein